MLTNYPNGVTSFGLPLIGSGPILTTGKVLFVNNAHGNASNGNKGEAPDRPLSSITAALLKCTANNFDHIICGPGHVETITAVDALVLDVAGVSLIGIGIGSNRPRINFTTNTLADMNITAANVSIRNMLFTGGIDGLGTIIDITGNDLHLIDIEYRDVTGEATNFLNIAASRCNIRGFLYRGAAAAGGIAAIQASNCEFLSIRDFFIDGNFSTGAINFFGVASLNVDIREGYIRNRNASDICIVDTVTGSTGKIGPNLMLSLADNAANITESITGATWRLFGPIKVVNLDGEQAFDINTTVSADA